MDSTSLDATKNSQYPNPDMTEQEMEEWLEHHGARSQTGSTSFGASKNLEKWGMDDVDGAYNYAKEHGW